MASLISLSPSPSSSTTSHSLHHPLTLFKGNAQNLKSKSSVFRSLELWNQKAKPRTPLVVLNQASSVAKIAADSFVEARFRLNNLGPQPGATKKAKRKGRGHSAGQGGSCGFGMKGQKSRSGPGVRKGFEGGQMPLYRRIPKLRGIAGGMHAGLPKFVHVNLKDIEAARFKEGEEVSLESLKKKGLINPSGRDRRLPLKAAELDSILSCLEQL